GHPLSFADRRPRQPAAGAGGHRLAGGRDDHGAAAPRLAHRGGAVPPREHRFRTRPRDAAQFPRPRRGAGMSSCKALLATAVERPLTRAEGEAAFSILFAGDATPAQMGGFLMALRTRGETVDEYAAAAAVM